LFECLFRRTPDFNFLRTFGCLLGTGSSSPCPAAHQHPIVLRPRQPKTTLSTTIPTASATSFNRVVSLSTHEPLLFNDANRYEAWHSAMREKI
jgi:hypothetical protein